MTTSAGWPANSSYFHGTIDDVAIYPNGLTLDQVQSTTRTVAGPSASPANRPTRTARRSTTPDRTSYWRLDETCGTIAKDTTPDGADGIYAGGVTQGVAGGIAGTSDTAVTLNGVDGAVASAGLGRQPDQVLRRAVVQHHDEPGGKLIGFGSSQTGLSGSYDRHVYMFDDGRLRFGVWTGQTNVIDTTQAYNDGKWHHMVATQGADGMKLYVDGALVGTNPQTQAQGYDGYWRVGGDNTWGGNSSNYFAGSIDDVAVYSSVLSASTVTAHYKAAAGPCRTRRRRRRSPTTADLKASFDGTGSNDSDGTIASYSWDFGDGTAAGTSATPNHTYAAAGTYTVKLTVTDDNGAPDTVTHA